MGALINERYHFELTIAIEIEDDQGRDPEELADEAVKLLRDHTLSEVDFITDIDHVGQTTPRKGPL